MTNNLPYRSFHSSILNYAAPAIRSPINKTLPSYLTFPSILGYPIAKYLSRISKHATRCTFSRWWIRSGNKHRVARALRLKPRRWNSWPEKFNPPPLCPRIPLAKSVQLNPFLFVKRLRFNSCRDTLFISNRVIHPPSPSSFSSPVRASPTPFPPSTPNNDGTHKSPTKAPCVRGPREKLSAGTIKRFPPPRRRYFSPLFSALAWVPQRVSNADGVISWRNFAHATI